MRRLSIALILALVLASGAAAKPPAHLGLKRYLENVDVRVVHSYRGLLQQTENLLSEESQVNVDPVVEKLNRLADRFEDFEVRWQSIHAPAGLRVRHRGMGRVFVLFANAIRIHAAALYTRHRDEILAAGPKVEARLRSAAYLQQRWAAALQGALIRAKLRVPGWVHGMATGR